MAKQFCLQGFTQQVNLEQGQDTLTVSSHSILPSPGCPALQSFSKITGSGDSISQDVLQLQPWQGQHTLRKLCAGMLQY